MRNALPFRHRLATRRSMHRQLASLLVFVGLLLGAVVMPAVAHASGDGTAHASEVLDMHEIGHADHMQGADKDMPCHNSGGHHHCSIALQAGAQAVAESLTHSRTLPHPGTATPLASRSQAPPLDPPTT